MRTAGNVRLRPSGALRSGCDQICDSVEERSIMERRFREIRGRTGLKSRATILFAVLVRDHHNRHVREMAIGTNAPHKIKSIHSWHVDIAEDQVVVGTLQCVPTIQSIDGNIDFVSSAREQLALDFAHRE
jgi:hypothetical protein